MYKRLNWIIILVLMLSLPALACGVFGGDEAEPTAVPAVEEPAVVEESAPESDTTASEPADTPVAEPTAVEEEPAAEEPASDNETVVAESEAPALSSDSLNFASINELPFDSYRVTMMLEFSGVKPDGEEVTQAMNADFAYTTEPPANSMSMSFTGIAEELGTESIEMAEIEGTTYMVIPEMGCITTQGDDLSGNPFADMLNPDEFLNDLEDAKYEGRETVNGILTHHYSFNEAAFLTADMGTDDIKDAEGHVYVAVEGGFLVRMIVDATGKIDFFDAGVDQDGDLHIAIDLTDVDESFDIVAPAGCEADAAGGGSEYPMLDDAADISSFGGVMSYKTSLGTDDVLAFYDDALAAEGWARDEAGSFVGGGSALVSYSREGETLTLTIGPDDGDTGGSYVVLLSEPME